jgi:hypothetical protein
MRKEHIMEMTASIQMTELEIGSSVMKRKFTAL